jgi:acetaldehyde dehydrogenase
MMRSTIFCLSEEADTSAIARSIERMVDGVRDYVGGYRLKQEVQFDRIDGEKAMILHGAGVFTGIKTSVFLEVEGSAHYLPAYAGNLDIMTSAALSTGERLAEQKWN